MKSRAFAAAEGPQLGHRSHSNGGLPRPGVASCTSIAVTAGGSVRKLWTFGRSAALLAPAASVSQPATTIVSRNREMPRRALEHDIDAR
jgi:hypothetical protein